MTINTAKLFRLTGLLATFWAIGCIAFFIAIFTRAPQAPAEKTEAIVVLTGGENRIEEGLKLFANERAPDLFISGVYPSVTKKDIVKKWADNGPLPVCCITLGHEATTTIQNAEETSKWLEDKNYKTIRLVTSDFHMSRAVMEFKHRMPELNVLIHPIEQNNATHNDLWFWIVSFEEYHKTLVRWVGFILTPPKNAMHSHSDHTAGEHG